MAPPGRTTTDYIRHHQNPEALHQTPTVWADPYIGQLSYTVKRDRWRGALGE